MNYCIDPQKACDNNNYGENCEEECSSHCVQDESACKVNSGVCVGGCRPITDKLNTDWYLGERFDIHIRMLTFSLIASQTVFLLSKAVYSYIFNC